MLIAEMFNMQLSCAASPNVNKEGTGTTAASVNSDTR